MRDNSISNIITETMSTSKGVLRRMQINFLIDRLIKENDDISLIMYLHRLSRILEGVTLTSNLRNLGNDILYFIDDVNDNYTKLEFTEEHVYPIMKEICESFSNSCATLSNVYDIKFIVNKESTLYLIIGKENRKRLVRFFNKSISRHIAVLSRGCNYIKANTDKVHINKSSLKYLEMFSNWVAVLNKIRVTYANSKQNNIQSSIIYCQRVVYNLHDDILTIRKLNLEPDTRTVSGMLADLNGINEQKHLNK